MQAAAFVGLDRPTIAIRRAEGSALHAEAAAEVDAEGSTVPAMVE
jgi:hypothetical protein